MAKNRYRLRYEFWLEINKPDQESIADKIELLKSEKTFAPVVRDGIRLICDLRAGRLDVLFELFPWVRAELLEYMQSLQPPSDSAIQQRLDNLEQRLFQEGNLHFEADAGGPKKLLAPPVTPFEEADDELLIIKQARSESDSAQKFLDSAFNLIQ